MPKIKPIIHSACLFLGGLLLSTLLFAQGDLQQIKVHSPSLEGNLNGDSADRDVYVYLPPGYEDSGRPYPVIYFLHGYGVGAEVYVNGVLGLPGSVDDAMAAVLSQISAAPLRASNVLLSIKSPFAKV